VFLGEQGQVATNLLQGLLLLSRPLAAEYGRGPGGCRHGPRVRPLPGRPPWSPSLTRRGVVARLRGRGAVRPSSSLREGGAQADDGAAFRPHPRQAGTAEGDDPPPQPSRRSSIRPGSRSWASARRGRRGRPSDRPGAAAPWPSAGRSRPGGPRPQRDGPLPPPPALRAFVARASPCRSYPSFPSSTIPLPGLARALRQGGPSLCAPSCAYRIRWGLAGRGGLPWAARSTGRLP